MSENMKPSGIVWVGEIPQSWSLTRLQKVLQQVKVKNTGVKEKNLLSLSYGKIITKDIEGALGLIPESYDTYNIVKKGDIVLRLTDMQNDHVSLRTGLVQENQGIITSAYVTLRTISENSSYYHWYLYAFDITKEIYSFGQGVRQNLTYEELKKMLIPIPPIFEQTLIADFLDEQCEKIDSITTNLEKQIEILQKYKKSLITETVTKGLDKSVSMQDSGIEWIGDIPEHWKVKKIRYATTVRNETKQYFTGDIYIGLENVESSTGKLVETETEYEDGVCDIFFTNDVLFSKLRPYLEKAFVADFDGFCTGEFIVFKRFDGDNRFLFYYLISSGFIETVNASTYGTKMPRASWEFIKNLKIIIPNLLEQSQIAEYLDKQCSKIDSIIESKKEQLTKITQHKKSLIYEYVTGKKRVKEENNNGN